MKFNVNVNFAEVQKEFLEKKTLVLEDFLSAAEADDIYDFFNTMPPDWWYVAVYANDEMKQARNTSKNQSVIQILKQTALEIFHGGGFTYDMYRTFDNHVPNCSCRECQFRRLIAGIELKNLLRMLTGRQVGNPKELFASYYAPGCFLAPHHDASRGQIGFALGLTKNWKPEWGGCLHLLSEDYKKVEEIVVPGYNKLVLFDIPENIGRPHYVSHVVPGVKEKRLSFTGWFE